MINKTLLAISLSLSLAYPTTFFAQEYPSMLICKTNAWTARQYRDSETMKSIEGWDNKFSTAFRPLLENTMTDSNISEAPAFSKELRFTSIQTRNPGIRKITEFPDGEVIVLEHRGWVVNRFKDAVSFVWTSENKFHTWLVTIDLKLRRAVLFHSIGGSAKIDGEFETLDCH